MKSRIKVKLPTIETRDEAESIVGRIALATINKIKLTAKMDAELTAVRARYEGNLAVIDDSLKQDADTLRAWSETHLDQFPKGRKSIEFVQGVIGFRTGTPKLALLNRSWTWDKVLERLKGLKLVQYIRTKEEVDKDALINAARQNPHKDGAEAGLAGFGTKLVQEESFFIEPKLTDVETRQVAEVAS